MPSKKSISPLTEEEAQARMNKLVSIITSDAQKEINQLTEQSSEGIDEMKKSLVAEPKQIIDEWVEKLRAFTERQTKIHCARLRRIAKLRILEAYGDIRENIKNEARDRIKAKMSIKSDESDRILGDMLFQGLLRLMEPKVLVHTTKADLGRVSKHYDAVTKKYKDMTGERDQQLNNIVGGESRGNDLKLITSRHPLKDHYYGRIVISDKISSMFVDMNLYVSVDKVADEVFSHYAAYQDKAGTSRNWGMEALKQRGLHIMPRGPNISPLQLDMILSTLRGDPRTQAPVFQIKEETKKNEDPEENDTRRRGSSTSSGRRHHRVSSNAGRAKKVTIATENMAHGMRPSLSMMEPGTFAPPKYGYRQTQDSSDHVVGNSTDLYNLDFTSTTDLLSQVPSKSTMATMKASVGSEPGIPNAHNKSISADKEAPKALSKMEQQGGRSVSEFTGSSSRFSEGSQFSEDSKRSASPLKESTSERASGSPSIDKKESSKKKKT